MPTEPSSTAWESWKEVTVPSNTQVTRAAPADGASQTSDPERTSIDRIQCTGDSLSRWVSAAIRRSMECRARGSCQARSESVSESGRVGQLAGALLESSLGENTATFLGCFSVAAGPAPGCLGSWRGRHLKHSV